MTPSSIRRSSTHRKLVRQLLANTSSAAPRYLPVIVHTPQVGKTITGKYLGAALLVFYNDTFKYVREATGERQAILEFEVEIDGIQVNGVDMISWNEEGLINDFKVMIRPLKAVNLIHQNMGAMLQARG